MIPQLPDEYYFVRSVESFTASGKPNRWKGKAHLRTQKGGPTVCDADMGVWVYKYPNPAEKEVCKRCLNKALKDSGAK